MEITTLPAAIAGSTASPVGRIAPNALATERFNALMNNPADSVSEPTGVQAALQSAFTPAVDVPPTLGNQILAGLQTNATELSDKWRNITAGLEHMAAGPSVSHMLRLQADVLQVTVQYELVGKALARSTQDIDTLVRMS